MDLPKEKLKMQNKLPKKVQVSKNQTTIFVLLAVASFATVASIMVSRAMWTQASYTNKVIGKKEAAVDQLEANKAAVDQLTSSYKSFNEQSPNLIGGTPEGTGPRDGSNSTLILDSLPENYNFPALASSIEKLLTGYNISSITGSDDSVNQTSAAAASVEIPIGVSVSTSYDGMKNLIGVFDRSIRPFKITKLQASGSSSDLELTLDMVTYYQPATSVKITEESVQ